jgi:hypothetical protein
VTDGHGLRAFSEDRHIYIELGEEPGKGKESEMTELTLPIYGCMLWFTLPHARWFFSTTFFASPTD